MQRKNSILNLPSRGRIHRSGMAMIMAIAVIVIVATILALSLSLTTQTTKKTTDLYLYEQAVILSHSAAEYAMLRISQANKCSLPSLNFPYPKNNPVYNIDITMQYISTAGSNCETNALNDGTNYGTTTNLASNGTVIIDTSVTSNVGTEPIRYFRRTIQKL